MTHSVIDPGKVQVLVAGGLGAFLSVLFQRSANKLTIFTTLVTAETVDYYFAKPVWSLMHSSVSWADEAWQGPVAFTLGLLAIFIVGGVIKMCADFWRSPWDTVRDLFVSVLERFLPDRKGK